MEIHYREFSVVKRGNTDDEYEDAFKGDERNGRFAVADGATGSAFAKEWARHLVEQFVEFRYCDPDEWWTRWLPGIQQRWTSSFVGRALTWHGEAKLQQEGACATFLGLTLAVNQEPPCPWQAVAVGDSCVFHTRDAKLLCAFPVGKSEEFGNAPPLVRSLALRRGGGEGWVKKKDDGLAEPDDHLWIMTDALAQWFLKEHEDGRQPWLPMQRLLASSMSDDDRKRVFGEWIEELRNRDVDKNSLHNDDVTLLAITL